MFSDKTPLNPLTWTWSDLDLTTPVRVVIDSRQLKAGEVFLACPGEYTDGRDFIQAALSRGAAAVLWDTEDDFVWSFGNEIPNLGISHLRQYMGLIAADALNHPGKQLDLIGVTGTNGKTSITQWLAQALDQLGQPCGIMGTVGNGFWQRLETSTHTTLDAWSVQQWLKRFVDEGAKAVAMEVSSHGLDQFRVNGVPFKSAIFTNLTRDHLDYHGDMASYGDIKSRLFFWQGLEHAIINVDDAFGIELLQQIQQSSSNTQVYAYGFAEQADIRIAAYQPSLDGTCINFNTPWGDVTVQTQLIGRFNAQNLAACVAVLGAQGYDLADIAQVLGQIQPATGRMDGIREAGKPLVVIDYAHTPDALEKALVTLHELKQNGSQVWCVFGCGGNRDKGKRSLMGAAASQYADQVVVTTDNPRLEVPQDILNDILPAVVQPAYVTIERAEAIEYAIAHAGSNDIVLIAGKGHETYQDVGGVKIHFSDFECARTALAQRA